MLDPYLETGEFGGGGGMGGGESFFGGIGMMGVISRARMR